MIHIASSSSPVGSIIFSVLALLIISLAVLLILRYYLPLRSTPAFYLVPIFFGLWLPSIVIILLPVDLASSAATGDEATRGIWLPERVILVSWRITYWLTFALTWFILPILAEYSDAGYREPKDKLLYSLRSNAQFHATVLGFGSIGLVIFFIKYGFKVDSVKALVMALAYCWGLILAIYLMGHGLVSIPRHLIRGASISRQLRRLQGKAPKVYEQMEDSLMQLEEIEGQVAELARRKVGSAMDFQDWIEELQEIANIPETQPQSSRFGENPETAHIPHVITEKYLAELTRKLVRAKHARSRYVSAWSRLVAKAAETQTILDSAASKKLEFGDASPHTGWWEKTKILTPYTRYLCYYYALPYAHTLLGIFLAAASACIVWSEVVKVAYPKLSIIRLSVVHHWVGDRAEVGFAGQLISAIWICYMCAAALISVTEVKVWRGRALVRRNTAHESAFWYAMQVAKLTIPLSYNFMTFLSDEVYTKTTFYKFLGSLINLTPLGRTFDDIFPIVVLFPVLATLFGVYGKVKRLFVGMDVIDDDEGNETGYGTGSWREGRDLIARELGGNSLFHRREEAIARLSAPGGTSAPVLSIPASHASSSSPARSPARMPNSTRRNGRSTTTRVWDEEPAEEENFFQLLGHRMKNTVDTLETPKWMQDIGQGIKKPKWMGGDDNAGEASNSRGTDFRRWFGGGDGQIRL